MAIIYSAYEIIKIAVEIEKNGYRFYSEASEAVRYQPAADLFRFLAGQEEIHRALFEKMEKTAPHTNITESYPGELDLYLKAIADAVIFRQAEGIKALAARTLTDRAALDIGIVVEKDSILYYTELLRFVSEKERPLVEKVRDEEKNHFVRLTALSNTLT